MGPDGGMEGLGTIVTLTAVPATGSYFAGWSDGTNTSQALTWKVTMDGDKNVSATFTSGTPTVTTWAKTYGATGNEEAYSIQQTSDGGYTVAGYTFSFGTGGDIWVLKLNADGSLAWQKTYGGSSDEQAYSIQQTSDGGYIVAGYTTSFGTSDTDIWILKLDSYGNVDWQKTYGGTGVDHANSIQQTSDGGYIVAGYTASFGAGGQDIWVLKLNSDGSVAWQKTYGGSNYDYANSIQQTSDGGYIVAGSTGSFGAGGYNTWVLKLNSNGSVAWQKTYGGSTTDGANSIQQTSDGGYIVAGQTGSFGAESYDFWLLRLNSNGSVAWQKTYGGSNYDVANSIQQTSDGGYIVAGYTYSFGAEGQDIWVLKLNSDGSVAWQKTYGGSNYDVANSIQQTSDGGYIVAGQTALGAGGSDIWVLKLDSEGNLLGCPAGLIKATSVTGVNTAASVTTPVVSGQDTLITPQQPTIVTVIDTAVSAGEVCTGIPPCSYSIDPTSASYLAAGGTYFPILAIAPAGCAWTATSNDGWITINSGSNGTGNGIVNYSVAENTGPVSRNGTMTIAGQTFTVTQAAPGTCTHSIEPTSYSLSNCGNTGSQVLVNADAGCGWTATSNDPWIHITTGSSGIGMDYVTYSVETNSGSDRPGTMTIAGQTFTVYQSSTIPCIPAPVLVSPPNGATGVYLNPTLTWNASVGANGYLVWVSTDPAFAINQHFEGATYDTFLNIQSGLDPFTLYYWKVQAYNGYYITHGDWSAVWSFTTESCSYSLNPPSASVPDSGSTGSTVSVAASAGCNWTAISNNPDWIAITGGASGSGNGTVTYNVSPNTGPARTGTMTIANQTFTVNQASPICVETPGTFSPSGSMTTGRWQHTATLLTSGKVLIAGGFPAYMGSPLSSAELYDPSTGTFTPTGTMNAGRMNHTATLLSNGKVLITGGFPKISSAELYDPDTDSFAPTGSMSTPRFEHTATLLTNGKVLIAGGVINSEYTPTSSAELYDPSTGTFTSTGNLVARFRHTATLLSNGKVLVAGGMNDIVNPASSGLSSAELYDPATGTFTTTDSMSTPRFEHTATLLTNGKALIAGGGVLAEYVCPALNSMIPPPAPSPRLAVW